MCVLPKTVCLTEASSAYRKRKSSFDICFWDVKYNVCASNVTVWVVLPKRFMFWSDSKRKEYISVKIGKDCQYMYFIV